MRSRERTNTNYAVRAYTCTCQRGLPFNAPSWTRVHTHKHSHATRSGAPAPAHARHVSTRLVPRRGVKLSKVESSQVKRPCERIHTHDHAHSHKPHSTTCQVCNTEIAGNRARVFRVAGENSTTSRRTRLQTVGLIRSVHVRYIM
jgi:hypothetical protein